MTINKFYVSLLAAVALTACTSDDESSKQTVSLEDSPVMIRLSAGGGAKTRASVESTNTGMFNLDSLGIFMLATDTLHINHEEDPITWEYGYNAYEPSSPYSNPWAVWIENVASNAVINNDSTRTDILWCDGMTRWYPVGNWYNYRFYGYYPYVDSPEVTATQRVVNYTGLDGTKDIIWGRSLGVDKNDPHEKYRYSGRYFRQAGYSEMNPVITFEHKLMRLQFCIQGLPDSNALPGEEYDAANSMIIDTIMIDKVPTRASLIVADLDDKTNGNDGKITFNWTSYLKTLGVLGENDGVFVKEQIQNDSIIKVGQPILLPVLDADATAASYNKYRVIVRLRNTAGDLFSHEKPIDLRMNDTYQPGKSYRVILQIAGPKQVTMSATLVPWDPDESSIESLVFD